MAADDTAGGILRGYLNEQLDRLPTLTADTLTDPEVVHDTRVALRRMRSTLRTFTDLFLPDEAARFDTEARWLAGLLGDLRDLDVLTDRLARHTTDDPELTTDRVAPVLSDLAERRELARLAAEQAVDSERYSQLLELIKAWRSGPPLSKIANGPAGLLHDRVRRTGRKERARVKRASRPGARDEQLHRARKAAKRHRYALELEARAGTRKSKKARKKRKRRIKRSRRMQQLLGRHQDAVVAADLLASGREDNDEAAATQRRLIQLEAETADTIRKQFTE